jgi:translocation and assembly module TamB
LKKWARRAALGLLCAVGLIVVAVAAALIYANSRAGGERILRIALSQANGAFQGRLDAEQLELHGNHLIVHRASLRDPEGALVAQVETLEARVSMLALIRRTIRVRELKIVAPVVHLRSDERGLNLVRAIQAKHPSPPRPPSEKSPSQLAIALEEFELQRGAFDFELLSDGQRRFVQLHDLEARASGAYASPSHKFALDLDLTGTAARPTHEPLSLRVHAKSSGERRSAQLALAFAGLRLDASADSAGDELRAHLDRLELPPGLARAWLPSYPLLASVSASGDGARHGDVAAAKVEVKAGQATLTIDGSLDVARLTSPGVTVRARGINLRELLAAGPESSLSLEARAEGGGKSLESLDGMLDLVVPTSTMSGTSVGPIQIEARAKSGVIHVQKLVADLPGLRIAGGGKLNAREAAFSATLTASNLDRLSKALGSLVGQRPLQIGGSGELQVALKGPLRHPGIALKGGFPRLRYEGFAAEKLSLSGNVPDVRKPLQSQLSLTASRVLSGGRVVKDVGVKLTNHDRNIVADVRATGFLQLALHAGGTVDSDHKGILLSALQLEYPQAQWSLQRAAHVRFAGPELSTEPLELRSGGQAIRAAGSLRGRRIDADLQIHNLDLALLPKPVVSPALNLAGLFSAELSARGSTAQPALQVKAELQSGRFKQYRDLALKLDGGYDKDRAVGTANARGFGTELRTDFDLPLQALRARRRAPVRLELTLNETPIENILRALDRPEKISGAAAASVVLSGTADDPQLKLVVRGKELRHQKSPPTDLNFIAQSQTGGLALNLDWSVANAKSSVALRTPLTVGALLARPPTLASLGPAPIQLDVDIHDLPLDVLHDAGLIGRQIRGKLSARGEVRGKVKAPIGKLALSVAGGAIGRAPPIDASLVANASAAGMQTSINAQRENRRLLDLTASLQAPPDKASRIDDLISRPLSINATLGPTSIEELRALTGNPPRSGSRSVPAVPGAAVGRDNQSRLDGVIRADLSISGSLANPKVQLRSEFDQLSSEKISLGKGKLDYSYGNASSKLSVDLASTAGTLSVQGQAGVDLSYPAVRRGLSYANAPVSVTLNSSHLDLAFLSGVTEMVPRLGGTVDADATVQGTIGAPSIRGKLEWANGAITLAGYGEYRQVHLLVEGTNDTLQLRELVAHSGSGQVRVTADGRRSGKSLTLTGKVNLDKFPIISDDQLVATVSMQSTLDGEIAPQLVNVRRFQIPSARIELPDTKRKDLQRLDRPEDIVLLRNGVPTNEKRYEKATASLSGLGGAGAVEEAPPQKASGQIVIVVDAPRNIWIKGNDLNIEIGLSDGFKVEVAPAPQIFGEIKLLQGRADVIGRRFDVQKGSTVRFTGPVAVPVLDVTAVYNNEREQVKVTVTVTGRVKKLLIKTSSEPPLTETEIYTLIATGHRTLKANSGSTSASSLAVSAIGSLAASELKNVLSAKLPLDVLSIEAGESGGLQGTKVEAGTYVTDRIYIGYTARINARTDLGENANEVHLDYQISPRWSFEATYGDAKAGSADVIWSRDY